MYLPHQRVAKNQASLSIYRDLQEPSLLVYTKQDVEDSGKDSDF